MNIAANEQDINWETWKREPKQMLDTRISEQGLE